MLRREGFEREILYIIKNIIILEKKRSCDGWGGGALRPVYIVHVIDHQITGADSEAKAH